MGRHLPAGDVWSFAIVMSRIFKVNGRQLIPRAEKYLKLTEKEEKILNELVNGNGGRKVVLENRDKALKYMPEELREDMLPVLRRCLRVEAEKRPDFHRLVGSVQDIRVKRKLREYRKNPLG